MNLQEHIRKVLREESNYTNTNVNIGNIYEEEDQEEITEKWSEKYKKSINCNNPKGFSQKAHCAGKHKKNEIDEYARTLKNARQQGVGLRFPKSAIKSNPSRFRPYNRKGVNESDLETNQNDKRIVCEKCGWSWDLSDGGDDPYTCHKCGNENHKEMNLQESIRRIIRKETKLIPMIRRRVPHDDLEREFEASLDATSKNLFYLIKNGGGVIPLGRFITITVSRLIDRIHYEIYSTTPEDSVWYVDVFNSLKDYYKDRIEVRYKKLMSEI